MNCEIRIYDKSFNWLGVVKTAESVQFKRCHYDVGGFEIHIHPDKRDVPLLCQRGNYIIINGDMEKMGIVREIVLEESRERTCVIIYGDTVKGFTKQRFVIPPTKTESPESYGYERIQGNAETVLKHYLKRNLTESPIAGRSIPFIEIAEDKQQGIEFPWQERYRRLNEVIQEIAEYGKIGWKAYFMPKDKKIVYDTVLGTDRTLEQTTVSPVVFKMEFANVGSYKYTEDYGQFRTTGICGGSGEDENRLIYTIGTEFEAENRFEEFLDCGNAANINELIYYGNQKLNEYKEVKNIEADTLPRTFAYGKDYFLGDLVSVYIDRLNLYIQTRITEINEIWERETGYRCQIQFGHKLPNLFTVLKNKTEVR